MTLNRIVALLIFLTAVSCIIGAGFLSFAMIGEINRKLPENEQISYYGGHLGKFLKIRNEYRRLCPKGRLVFLYDVVFYSGLGLLGILALGSRLGVFK
jgi:hypothetical protein